MISITTKELEIENELKRKIEFICDFCNTKPTIINGNIRNIKGTNIAYVKPHIIKVNNTDYLMFDECDEIFVNGYDETIKFKDLENHIKNHF